MTPEEIEEGARIYQQEIRALREPEQPIPTPPTTGGEPPPGEERGSFSQEMRRQGIYNVVPSIVGGALGPLALPARLVPWASRAIGAGVGSTGGEGVSQWLGSNEAPYKEMSGTDKRLELLKQFGIGAGGELGGEMLARGARRGAGWVAEKSPLAPLVERLRGGPEATAYRAAQRARDTETMQTVRMAQDYLETAPGEAGLTLTPESIAEYMRPSRTRSAAQRASGVLRETGQMKSARELSNERASLDINRFVRDLGEGNPSTAAALGKLAVQNSRDAHRLATRAAWQGFEADLADLGSTVAVDIRPLWKAGAEELEKAGIDFRPGLRRTSRLIQQEGTEIASTRPISRQVPTGLLDAGGKPLMRTVIDKETFTQRLPYLSFEEAQQLRSALREAADGTQPMPTVDQGKAKQLLGILDSQIDKVEEQLILDGRTDIVDAYRQAKDLSRQGHTRFNNAYVRAWLQNVEPEKIYAGIAARNSPTRTRAMREMYEESIERGQIPDTAWVDVQDQFFRDVLSKGRTASPRGVMDADPMLDTIQRYRDSGVLDELYPGPHGYRSIDNLERMLKVLKVTGTKSSMGQSVAFGIMQAKGLYYLSAGAAMAAAGYQGHTREAMYAAPFIIMGPAAVARLMADRKFARYLINGMAEKEGGNLTSKVIGQLATRAAEIKVEEELGDAELFVDPKLLEQVDPQTGELIPTLSNISTVNRPRVTLTPQGREDLLRSTR